MGYRVPGADEYQGDGFGTLSPDQYRARIVAYSMKKGAEVTNQYNPDGALRIWFTLEPLFIEGDEGAEMVDEKGDPISEEKTLIFFFDPQRMGLKPVVSKNRKFFASAMGLSVEQPVDFASEEAMAQALIGKEVTVTVDITANGKNKISDVRPVVQRVRRRRVEAAPLVAAAAQVFDLPAGEEPDDNDF